MHDRSLRSINNDLASINNDNDCDDVNVVVT